MRTAGGALILCLLCSPVFAGTYFAYSGVFSQDDNEVSVNFTISAPTTVTLQTWSYAGGTDPLSNVVSAGGFAPVLSLFDSGGNLLGFDQGGTAPSGCAPRAIDPSDGLCLDAYLQDTLNPDTYTVVLTEQNNTPNGPTLADGFVWPVGSGNFTGPAFLGFPGSFIDPGLNQRDAAYEFTVGAVDSSFALPEPSTALLLIPGLLALWCRARRRRT